jgi:hypothetical protein
MTKGGFQWFSIDRTQAAVVDNKTVALLYRGQFQGDDVTDGGGPGSEAILGEPATWTVVYADEPDQPWGLIAAPVFPEMSRHEVVAGWREAMEEAAEMIEQHLAGRDCAG